MSVCDSVDESAGLVRACETFPDDTMQNWCWPCVLRRIESLTRYKAQAERYRAALKRILNEIGRPDAGYPAPISNAHDIARAALQDPEEENT